MILVDETAQLHFRSLLEQQAIEGLGIRIRVVQAGTPSADCQLEFCESADLRGDEHHISCQGFSMYVEQQSIPYLEGAQMGYQKNTTGGQLTIKAPKIKGVSPAADSSLFERVSHLIETEINPGLAGHGGRCTLVEVDAEGFAVLKFGGGCHGCGMVETTVRDGIEKTLRSRIPDIKGVRDQTDHSAGENPYIKRAAI